MRRGEQVLGLVHGNAKVNHGDSVCLDLSVNTDAPTCVVPKGIASLTVSMSEQGQWEDVGSGLSSAVIRTDL